MSDVGAMMRTSDVVHCEARVTRSEAAFFLAEQARALQAFTPPAPSDDDVVVFTGVREPDTECCVCMDTPAAECREIQDLLPPLCSGSCRNLLCEPCHLRMMDQGFCPVCNR
jgi:hypothetical protein